MKESSNQSDQLERALSEIANAIQAAGLLAAMQRRHCDALAQSAVKLEAALERVISTLHVLQQGGAISRP